MGVLQHLIDNYVSLSFHCWPSAESVHTFLGWIQSHGDLRKVMGSGSFIGRSIFLKFDTTFRWTII